MEGLEGKPETPVGPGRRPPAMPRGVPGWRPGPPSVDTRELPRVALRAWQGRQGGRKLQQL